MEAVVWSVVAVLYLAVGALVARKIDAKGLMSIVWAVGWLPMLFVLWAVTSFTLGPVLAFGLIIVSLCGDDDCDDAPAIATEHGLG